MPAERLLDAIAQLPEVGPSQAAPPPASPIAEVPAPLDPGGRSDGVGGADRFGGALVDGERTGADLVGPETADDASASSGWIEVGDRNRSNVLEDTEEVLAGSVRTVNPNFPAEGFNRNCVECVIAAEQRFRGSLGMTAKPAPGPLSIYKISNLFVGRFQPVSGPMEIGSILRKAGKGARGIVYGAHRARGCGHVWNVRIDHGVVRFLDSQDGKRAGLAADIGPIARGRSAS